MKMRIYFYLIRWNDGSGTTSGIVEAPAAFQAYKLVEGFTVGEGSGSHYSMPHFVGCIEQFNFIEEVHP